MDSDSHERWIERIHLETGSGEPKPAIQVRDTDLVFLTIGSIVSNASFGAHDRPVDRPAVGGQDLGGAWTLWTKIAARQPDFGRPDQFLRDVLQFTMMTATVTFRGGLFERKFEWLVERQMVRQSPLPITASPWIPAPAHLPATLVPRPTARYLRHLGDSAGQRQAWHVREEAHARMHRPRDS